MGRLSMSAVILGPLLLAPGCENDFIEVCTPTTVEADDVDRSRRGPTGDAVLEARLRSGDRSLRGLTLRFEVFDGEGATILTEETETGGDGHARLDLTQRLGTDAAQRARSFSVGFADDDAYCGSSDTGTIDAVSVNRS